MNGRGNRKKINLLVVVVVLVALLGLAGIAQAQGGSGVFNYHVFLPLVSNMPTPTPPPYPYPLCFGEDIDWEGTRQLIPDGGNDTGYQQDPYSMSAPTTCIGWLHRDNSLAYPYPDADLWHLAPVSGGGHIKATVTGLPDGAVLYWGYCDDLGTVGCDTYTYLTTFDTVWSGVRELVIPARSADGGLLGISPSGTDQYNNVDYYILTLEVVQ